MIKLDSVSEQTEQGLKPCPFCGSNVEIQSFEGFDNKALYIVFCQNCGSRTSFHDRMENNFSKDKTIEAWNRRADNG